MLTTHYEIVEIIESNCNFYIEKLTIWIKNELFKFKNFEQFPGEHFPTLNKPTVKMLSSLALTYWLLGYWTPICNDSYKLLGYRKHLISLQWHVAKIDLMYVHVIRFQLKRFRDVIPQLETIPSEEWDESINVLIRHLYITRIKKEMIGKVFF